MATEEVAQTRPRAKNVVSFASEPPKSASAEGKTVTRLQDRRKGTLSRSHTLKAVTSPTSGHADSDDEEGDEVKSPLPSVFNRAKSTRVLTSHSRSSDEPSSARPADKEPGSGHKTHRRRSSDEDLRSMNMNTLKRERSMGLMSTWENKVKENERIKEKDKEERERKRDAKNAEAKKDENKDKEKDESKNKSKDKEEDSDASGWSSLLVDMLVVRLEKHVRQELGYANDVIIAERIQEYCNQRGKELRV